MWIVVVVVVVVSWWKVQTVGFAVTVDLPCDGVVGVVMVARHVFPVQQQEVVQPSGDNVVAPVVQPQHRNSQWTIVHTHQGPETPTVHIKLEIIDILGINIKYFINNHTSLSTMTNATMYTLLKSPYIDTDLTAGVNEVLCPASEYINTLGHGQGTLCQPHRLLPLTIRLEVSACITSLSNHTQKFHT